MTTAAIPASDAKDGRRGKGPVQHPKPHGPNRGVPPGKLGLRVACVVLAALIGGAWAVAAGVVPLADPVRRIVAAVLVVLAYVTFCVAVALRRHAAAQALRLAGQGWGPRHPLAKGSVARGAVLQGDDGSGVHDPSADPPLLIAHASQTGFAEQLAWQTAETLQAAGMAVTVLPLSALDAPRLAARPRALFVVSTTGEGDAPDTAVGFTRRVMRGSVDLHGLSYGVLSLGDRSYAHYCAFGSALDGWLHRHGAQPLFDTVQVDNGSTDDLRHWQQYLGVLSGNANMADWTTPAYAPWRLTARQHLNPGSPGGPAYLVSLRATDAQPSWRAGDIAEIGPRQSQADVHRVMAALGLDPEARLDTAATETATTRTATPTAAGERVADLLAGRLLPHDAEALAALAGKDATDVIHLLEQLPPLPHREYSIASLPTDKVLQLLVRQTRYPDGRLGLGSGWLTAHAPIDGTIALRIRENRGFHSPEDDRPMILIGNGTGLAGLRAHLKARERAGHHRNWLLFGERTSAHDQFFADELAAWRQNGVLSRLDLVFSRDDRSTGPEAPRHVQDRLAQVADDIRQWVDDGAAIYVCGSLQGMAGGVAAVLTRTLGDERLDALAETGRYRRDVY